jgi:excisionase family DNA binding protein
MMANNKHPVDNHTATGNPLLSPAELANFLRVPIGTVYKWNHEGTGPRMLLLGRHRRYRLADVEQWLESHADRPPSS